MTQKSQPNHQPNIGFCSTAIRVLSSSPIVVEEITRKATSFAKSFALSLAQLISDFPKEYWNFFPKYMTSHFRIKVIIASNGIAVRYVRPSRKLRVTASHSRGRLEGAIFPSFGATNMFRLVGTHGSSISHMTLANRDFANNHQMIAGTNLICPSDFGVAEVGEDVEFSFENVQFAWRIGNRDVVLYEYLLWILSPPATSELGSEFGSRQAVSKFGGFLSWAIFDVDNPKSFRLDYAKFLLTAARMLEDQFARLIVRSDIEEEELQEFLCDHRAILTSSLGYEVARCKVRLTGQDVVDFLLTSGSPPSKSLAVEIEPSHFEVMTPTGTESARLNGALDQARRYRTVLSGQGEFGNQTVEGLVVIGRSSTMDEVRGKSLQRLNQLLTQESISVITFDELLSTLHTRRMELEKRVSDLSGTATAEWSHSSQQRNEPAGGRGEM